MNLKNKSCNTSSESSPPNVYLPDLVVCDVLRHLINFTNCLQFYFHFGKQNYNFNPKINCQKGVNKADPLSMFDVWCLTDKLVFKCVVTKVETKANCKIN